MCVGLVIPPRGHEDRIHDIVHFCTTKTGQIRLLKCTPDPFHLSFFDILREPVMRYHVCRSYDFGNSADLEGFVASSASQRIGSNDEVNMVSGINRCE